MHFLLFRLGLCIASALPNAKLNINLGDNHFELSVMLRSIVTLQPPPQGEVVGGECVVFLPTLWPCSAG